MKYILLIAETQVEFDLRNDPDKSPAYWAAWKAYSEALKTAGVMVSSLGLPSWRSSSMPFTPLTPPAGKACRKRPQLITRWRRKPLRSGGCWFN